MFKIPLFIFVSLSFIQSNAQNSIEWVGESEYKYIEGMYNTTDSSYFLESKLNGKLTLSFFEKNEKAGSAEFQFIGDRLNPIETFAIDDKMIYISKSNRSIFNTEEKGKVDYYYMEGYSKTLQSIDKAKIEMKTDKYLALRDVVKSDNGNYFALVWLGYGKKNSHNYTYKIFDKDLNEVAAGINTFEKLEDMNEQAWHLSNNGTLFLCGTKVLGITKSEFHLIQFSKDSPKHYRQIFTQAVIVVGAKVFTEKNDIYVHAIVKDVKWKVKAVVFGLDHANNSFISLKESELKDFSFKAFGAGFDEAIIETIDLQDGSVVGIFRFKLFYMSGGGGGLDSPTMGTPMAMGGTGTTGWKDGPNTPSESFASDDNVQDFGVYKINTNGNFEWLIRCERADPQLSFINGNELFSICRDNIVQYDEEGIFTGVQAYMLTHKNVMSLIRIDLLNGNSSRSMLDKDQFPKKTMMFSDFMKFDESAKSLFFITNTNKLGTIKFN